MYFSQLLGLVYNVPLLITESGFWSIHKLIEAHVLRAGVLEPEERDRSAMWCGKKVDLPSMTIANGLAQIPVGGAIGRKLGNYAKLAGVIDMGDIAADIEEAEADPKVQSILFDIDSPGGMAMGTPELAARIADMRKPKYAFSDGNIASAAYYLAASTDGIFLTPSAQAGSIGTIMTYLDESDAYRREGLNVQVIKAGRFKGMGTPGTSLSPDHLQHLQERINQINDVFVAHVQAHRPDAALESMQGQMFIGERAVQAGLADQVVRDKGAVTRMLTGK
jgi:signal peptide peptidase SppA